MKRWISVGHLVDEDPFQQPTRQLVDEEVDPRTETFLSEVATLSRRYGVSFAACNCCGGLWLDTYFDYGVDNIEWDEEVGEYVHPEPRA